MFKLLGALFFLGVAFCGAYYLGKERQGPPRAEATFQPALYPVVNRSFALVVMGRNNGAFVARTLQSIFSQNYLDFRVFYIDNGSNDGSYELARDLIQESGQEMRVTMIRNEEPLGKATNLSRVVDSCADGEIVVVLEGEDWLAHEWVLARLNQYYANPDLWLTYGQSMEYPDYALGVSRPLEDKFVRHQPFQASHLKTFYAALFRQIQPLDLFFATDFAYMAPMLEMGQGHTAFIPEVLYIENRMAPPREDTVAAENSVRALKAYAPIERIPL